MPIGLIGDDIESVSEEAPRPSTSPSFRCAAKASGRSQSLGHHIANDAIRDWVLDKRDGETYEGTPLRCGHHRRLQHRRRRLGIPYPPREMGLRVVAQWSGDGTIAEMMNTPKVKLNLLHCYRFDELHQPPHGREVRYSLEYNFFGPTKIIESRRKIAAFDDSIKEKTEAMIARYQPMMDEIIAKYKPRL